LVVLAPPDHHLDWFCSCRECRDLKQHFRISAWRVFQTCCAFRELDSVVLLESCASCLLSSLYSILLQEVACIGELNNFYWRIKLTGRSKQSWKGRLVFFMSSDAVITLDQEYPVPFRRCRNMSFPTANWSFNTRSCKCMGIMNNLGSKISASYNE
jgi:hypothetical protein